MGMKRLLLLFMSAQFRQTVRPLYEKYCGEYMDLINKIRQG